MFSVKADKTSVALVNNSVTTTNDQLQALNSNYTSEWAHGRHIKYRDASSNVAFWYENPTAYPGYTTANRFMQFYSYVYPLATVNLTEVGVTVDSTMYLVLSFGPASGGVTETANLALQNANSPIKSFTSAADINSTAWGIRCKASVPILITAQVRVDATGPNGAGCAFTTSTYGTLMLLENGFRNPADGGSNISGESGLAVPAYTGTGVVSLNETSMHLAKLFQCTTGHVYQVAWYSGSAKAACTLKMQRWFAVREL